jgi:multisubunit Na+/H+ antiporter MnhE subunit
MMLASYWMGKRYYPVPYEVKKLLGYIAGAAILYLIQRLASGSLPQIWMRIGLGIVLSFVFLGGLLYAERKELQKLSFLRGRMP